MAATLSRIYTGQFAAAAAVLYTCPAGATAQITGFSVSNPSAGVRTFSVWLVPSGGSVTDANVVYDEESLAVGRGASLDRLIGHSLNAGDSLYGDADAATSVTAHVSAVVVTTA